LLPYRICQSRVEGGVTAAGDAGAGGRVATFAGGGETGYELLGVLARRDALLAVSEVWLAAV